MYGILVALIFMDVSWFPKTDPQLEAVAALRHLETISDEDRLYSWYWSTYAVPETERAEFETLMMRWQSRQLTTNANRRVSPVRLPNHPTLWYMDIRSFNWNTGARRAVALRDKTFKEPWIDKTLAHQLRVSIMESRPDSGHVIAIVDAYALYRRTYQTSDLDQNNKPVTDYYDLLFAEQRFPNTEARENRIAYVGRKEVSETYCKRGFVDFPKDEDDWFSAFLGGISAKDYDKAIKQLKARRGAVCKGSEDVKQGDKDASFVARQTRLVWIAPVFTRFNSIYGETFDQKRSDGKQDVEENAFTDQDRDGTRKVRDGGELLFTLPAGDGVATLVVNKDGKRVEEVPPDIAINTRDPRDRRVRNGTACYVCHAEWYGWIPLNNQIEKNQLEVDLKLKGKDARQAVEDFDAFFVGWQDDLKPVRIGVQEYWKQATKSPKDPNGWTGLQIGQKSLKWKWKYDDPIDLNQACLETGAPENVLRPVLSRIPLRQSINLTRKQSVPRTVWDRDVFPVVMTELSRGVKP